MRLSSTLHEGSASGSFTSVSVSAVRPTDDADDDGAERYELLELRRQAAEYGELLELFEWQSEPASRRSRAALERAHLESVAGRVNSRLPAVVLAELEALPDDSYLALIRSPEVFHAAFFASVSSTSASAGSGANASAELAAKLSAWIAVERARLGAATSLDGKARSAGCDRVLFAGGGVVRAIEELPRLVTGGPGPGPVLDLASELPARVITRFPERVLVTPSPEETALTVAKLEAAWRLLRALSPLAHQLVGDVTQVVCARTAVSDERFYTASDATTIGVVHLANAHLPRKSAAEVASELVHEAIHQALFRWELRHRLLEDAALATEKVRSPWTGATLDLYAFVHACFVWYGVANLWRQPNAAGDLADALTVARLRRTAEAGFAQRPLDRIGSLQRALSPALRSALAAMTAAVAPI